MNTGHVKEPNKSLNKISQLAGLGFNLRSHDFRRTFTTLCNELGIELSDAGMLLNHAKRNVTDNYVIRSLEFQRAYYDRIVTKIESYIKNTITSETGKYHTLGLTNAFRVFFYGADRNELIAETEQYTEGYWND
jgi:site-specific recombinase XerD